jgi:WD40 repeat protein
VQLHNFDLATGRQRQSSGAFVLLACSPDGKRLAVSSGLLVRVIDATTSERVYEIDLPPFPPDPAMSYVHGATFLPDGQSLVVLADRSAFVCDVTTGKDPRPIEMGMWRWPYEEGLAFSADGRRIAFVQNDQNGHIEVHELPDGTEVGRSEAPAGGTCLALSPDGRTVAWGNRAGDPLVHLLDVATGKERHTFAGHQGGVETLSFSADGKKLVSGGTDATLVVWDMTALQAAPGSGRPEKPIAPRKAPTNHQPRPTGTARE